MEDSEKILFLLVMFVIMGVLFNLSIKATLKNRENGLVNQFYARATNCFAAVNPTQRTPEHVKWCYDEAQKATGYDGRRYTTEDK